MSSVNIYGIKNCDTMKKALNWLNDQGVDYVFHDYKKGGADEGILSRVIESCGWEVVINQRGTTWRKLPDGVKNAMNEERALEIVLENPSIIKRPLLIDGDRIVFGFKDQQYAEMFS